MEENHSFQVENIFIVFLCVCVVIILHHPIPLARLKVIKYSSHCCLKKVFEIFASSLFYIWFGLDFGTTEMHF